MLDVYSEGQSAGTPGAGPIMIVVPQDNSITVDDVPSLAASSTKATAAFENLAAAGVEFAISAHALGPMTEMCSLHEQIDIFSTDHARGDGTEANPGSRRPMALMRGPAFSRAHAAGVRGALWQSLTTVSDAFVVTDDGLPVVGFVG